MKYIGVSTPAWTIPGKPKERELSLPSETEPRIVDADALSRKHLYPNVKDILFHPPPVKKTPKEESPAKSAEPANRDDNRHASKSPPKKKKDTKPPPPRFPEPKHAGNPGPGTYMLDLGKPIPNKMPNFTMGYKQDIFARSNSVSTMVPPSESPPPIYSTNRKKEMNKTTNFSKTERFAKDPSLDLTIPGPGKYVIPVPLPPPSSTHGTFGNRESKRKGIYGKGSDCAETTPYNVVQHTIEHMSKMSLERASKRNELKTGSEDKMKQVNEAPAVVSHSKNDFIPSGAKWKFGMGKRPQLNITSQTVIGPGEYEGQSKPKDTKSHQLLPRVSNLSRANRAPMHKTDNFPAPNQYYWDPKEDDTQGQRVHLLHRSPSGPKWSLRGRYDNPGSKELYKMPGPIYFFDHTYGVGWGLGRSTKFGTSMRPADKPARADTAEVINGPGMYEVTGDIARSGGIKFSKAKRKPLVNDTDPDVEIGPGQYNIKSTVPQLQPYEALKLQDGGTFDLNLI